MSGVVVLRCASRVGEGTCSRNQEIWFLCLTLQIQYSFMVWIWRTGNAFHTPCSPHSQSEVGKKILSSWSRQKRCWERDRTGEEMASKHILRREGCLHSPVLFQSFSLDQPEKMVSTTLENPALRCSQEALAPQSWNYPIRSGQRLVLSCHWDWVGVSAPAAEALKGPGRSPVRHVLVTRLALK